MATPMIGEPPTQVILCWRPNSRGINCRWPSWAIGCATRKMQHANGATRVPITTMIFHRRTDCTPWPWPNNPNWPQWTVYGKPQTSVTRPNGDWQLLTPWSAKKRWPKPSLKRQTLTLNPITIITEPMVQFSETVRWPWRLWWFWVTRNKGNWRFPWPKIYHHNGGTAHKKLLTPSWQCPKWLWRMEEDPSM